MDTRRVSIANSPPQEIASPEALSRGRIAFNQEFRRPGTIPAAAQPSDRPKGRSALSSWFPDFHRTPAKANEPSIGESKMCPAPPVNTPTGRDCLAATPPGFARGFRRELHQLLIRPHSQTPGFQSPARPKAGTGNQPGTKSPSCSSHTHHRSIHVTSEG